jgi:predicted nucleic acid-binding protein
MVTAIRESPQTLSDLFSQGQIWLSSVVAFELYAGTRSQGERQFLVRMVHGVIEQQRLLVPTLEDWTQAGTLIARRIRLQGSLLQGSLLPRDHLADILIVVSAARLGGEIQTANRRHFEAWIRLARQAGLDVTLAPATNAV